MAPIILIVDIDIKPGMLEEFDVAAKALRELTSTEPGTLRYDWHVSEDGTRQITIEEFADSDAFIVHNEHVAPALPAFMETATVTGAQVFGEVSDEARERLKGLGAVHFIFDGGLDR